MENDKLQIGEIDLPCVLISDSDGLSTYQIKTVVKRKKDDRRIQVVAIGPPNDEDIKSILLLGETGTGKTKLINALLNNIYGIRFEDTHRLQLKDQVIDGERQETQSQTDYITAYVIYHQREMIYDCNFMIIDTPGFNDTRGIDHKKSAMDRLRSFLLEDFGIQNLHCIGIVIKASENRDLISQKEVLSRISSFLGKDVDTITHLMATFASEDTTVDKVAEVAGIHFISMHRFDNWPLYIPHRMRENFEVRQYNNLKFRWENMSCECTEFLQKIIKSKPISLKRTRELLSEKRKVDDTLIKLKANVAAADKVIKYLKTRKAAHKQKEKLSADIEWKRNVSSLLREKYRVMNGYHAHNCPSCDKTCTFPCETLSQVPSGVAGGVAGAALAGGAAGAVAGPPGAAVGAAVGGIIGGVGAFKLAKRNCKYVKEETICGEDGCLHKFSEHVVENERIIKTTVTEEIIDYKAKEKYDSITSELKDLESQITAYSRSRSDSRSKLFADIKSLRLSHKQIEELSYNSETSKPSCLIDNLIAETSDIGHIKLYQILKNAMDVKITGVSALNDKNTLIYLDSMI